MKKYKRIIAMVLSCALLAGFGNVQIEAAEKSDITFGADVGWLNQLENDGITWVDDNGATTDALQLLKDKGVTAVRIRAFVKPDSTFEWTKPDGTTCMLGYADTAGVLYTAERADALGMDIDLVLHYSDHFADPLYQDVPTQWADATAEELEKYVYDYTYYIMNELKNRDIYPKWVEVGNEVNGGILYPYGSSTSNFQQLTDYLNCGYDAVKAVSPSSKVVTHLANMGNYNVSVSDFTWFFDNFINEYGGKTDVLGMSYYPYWLKDNDIEGVTNTFYDLANRYDKEVMICETGGDETDADETHKILRQQINALNVIPGNKGVAIFYWEPEANSSLVPDEYPLGATSKVDENVFKFTSALDAFSCQPEFLDSEVSFEIKNINSEKALNVSGGSTNNLANIEQYTYGEWNSQKWIFEKVDKDYYKIVNKNSQKVLDINAMSTEVGANCIQYEYNSGWNQMWKIEETEDGAYLIKNRLSGLYLGIKDASTDEDALCVQMSNDGNDNIKWRLLVTE